MDPFVELEARLRACVEPLRAELQRRGLPAAVEVTDGSPRAPHSGYLDMDVPVLQVTPQLSIHPRLRAAGQPGLVQVWVLFSEVTYPDGEGGVDTDTEDLYIGGLPEACALAVVHAESEVLAERFRHLGVR